VHSLYLIRARSEPERRGERSATSDELLHVLRKPRGTSEATVADASFLKYMMRSNERLDTHKAGKC